MESIVQPTFTLDTLVDREGIVHLRGGSINPEYNYTVRYAGTSHYPTFDNSIERLQSDELVTFDTYHLARVGNRIYSISRLDDDEVDLVIESGAELLFRVDDLPIRPGYQYQNYNNNLAFAIIDGKLNVLVYYGDEDEFIELDTDIPFPPIDEIALIRDSLIITYDGRLFRIIEKVNFELVLEDTPFHVVDAINQVFDPIITLALDDQGQLWMKYGQRWELFESPLIKAVGIHSFVNIHIPGEEVDSPYIFMIANNDILYRLSIVDGILRYNAELTEINLDFKLMGVKYPSDDI